MEEVDKEVEEKEEEKNNGEKEEKKQVKGMHMKAALVES